MDKRLEQARRWISNLHLAPNYTLKAASEDASFRRYFRVTTPDNTWILMDAPPNKESLDAFLKTHALLTQQGVHTPSIKAQDPENGFLLLEDLGNDLYLNVLDEHSADSLYSEALDALIRIQGGQINQADDAALPSYDARLIEQELDLFIDWYLIRHLNIKLTAAQQQTWGQLKSDLTVTFNKQPQVWVHRDFHSRNLLKTKDNSPGVIDFQDLLIGPITYDLCSIFKDCYIEWPRMRQIEWLKLFHEKASHALALQVDFDQLVYWYDMTGLQRHLKVLGIFCRLNYRDSKPNYLNDLPLVYKYVMQTCKQYPQLQDFHHLMLHIHGH